MATRTVIEINEDLCDGCGLCAGGCHEGALRIIDGKARLVGESLCDGLGACIGECPRGALKTIQREAEEYSERRVLDNILPMGMATVAAHLDHLKSHGQDSWYNEALAILKEKGLSVPAAAKAEPGCGCGGSAGAGAGAAAAQARPAPSFVRMTDNGMSGGCPGSAARAFASAGTPTSAPARAAGASGGQASRLEQWPVQLHLINPRAPYFRGADILVAADCTAFACGAFHQALLAGRRLVIACPKLDSGKEIYVDKIRALVNESGAASLTVAIMDVPCCGGLKRLVDEALTGTAQAIPVSTVIVSAEGGSLTWL